jgi:predicted dehydrogenase
MMRERLRWGLLSTARINRRLIPAIRAAERSDLVAVASRSQSGADAYAADWEIPRAHGSYEDLLADGDLDAVYISVPNSLHAEWAVKAAEAGKHVLCEKPLAITVSQCDQIIAAAESAGVVIMEALMHLHRSLLRKARALVREGAVGRVELVRGAFSFALDRPGDVRWRPELGGGSLWDIGIYPVSVIRWIAGEPESVFGWQTLGESGVDAAFAGLLRLAGGALGSFDCGFRQQYRTQVEVVGTEGALVVERPFIFSDKSRIVLQRGYDEERIQVDEMDAYRCEVEALTAAALDGTPLPVPLAFSRANVSTLVALHESAASGKPVQVSQP